MSALFRGGPVTAEGVKAAMAGFYREIPVKFAGQYAQMMRQLVDGNVPLAFNCSAGKDRTGVAAALILSTLGVPDDAVMADYLLSNQYYRPKPPTPGTDDPTARMFAALPADAVQALMGVDRRYLEAAFASIAERGGLDRYLTEDLKLSRADIETLRRRYLVR
jgi:protein-tyrosine phosphatase